MRTEQFNTPVVEENLFHVCDSYEAAMHYDCQMRKSECEFRKGTNPGAGLFMILSFAVVMLLITYSFIF